MKIDELYIFPLKSARAQALSKISVTHEGPVGDRQWMLVDESGKFISQRTLPKLATVEVFYDETALTLGFENKFFKVSRNNSFQRKITVSVWNDSFEAALEPDLYSQALSQYLGVNCRLVRYAPYSQRRVRSTTDEWKPEVRFADGRPLLLINQKSVEDLNSRLRETANESILAEHFRGNIVYKGRSAYEEDHWKKIKMGEVIFSQPKKCARCIMVNIDQKSGQKKGSEILKTLAAYRRDGNGVFFGSLWIPENEGPIKIGDGVEVLE